LPNTIELYQEPPIFVGYSEQPVKILRITRDTAGYFTDALLTPTAPSWLFVTGIQVLDDLAVVIQFADSSAASAAGIVAANESPELPLTTNQPISARIEIGPMLICARQKLWIKTSANTSFLLAIFQADKVVI